MCHPSPIVGTSHSKRSAGILGVADTLGIERGCHSEQVPAGDVPEQERMHARLVEPLDVARQQSFAFRLAERPVGNRLFGIGFHRLAKGSVVIEAMAELVDLVGAHQWKLQAAKAWPFSS